MIAEHCKSKNGKQTRHAKAVAIGDYITNPQSKSHAEKCTAIAAFNLSAAVYDGKVYDSHAAAREMCATAGAFYSEGGKNAVDPIAHWSLSFQEKLSDKQLIELGKEFLKEMRVDPARHQVVMGVHRDTHNNHIHMMVNKVSVDGGYSTMGFSNGDRLYKLHSQKVVAEMSHRHGFKQLEKNRYAVGPDGKAVKKNREKLLSMTAKFRRHRQKKRHIKALIAMSAA